VLNRRVKVILAIGAMWQIVTLTSWAQANKRVKDQGEYDLYNAVTKETDVNKRLQILQAWKDKYPDSDFKEDRAAIVAQDWSKLGRPTEAIEAALEVLAINPRNLSALVTIVNSAIHVNPATPKSLNAGERAANTLISDVDSLKPETVKAADWNTSKPEVEALAQTTLGWVKMQKKENDAAAAAFRKVLQSNPKNGQVSYWLGSVLYEEKKYSPALFEFARAATLPTAEGGLSDGARLSADQYFERAYKGYHGSDEGIDSLKKMAASAGLPPDDLHIQSITEIAEASNTSTQGNVTPTPHYSAPPSRGVVPVQSEPTSRITRYVALVIGNNNYRHSGHLTTAIWDAQEVSRILKTQYGFATETLLDATRDQILSALNRYRSALSPDSALLIYYAGHGYFDQDTRKAYWLPIDARMDENNQWISADDITSDILAIRARQVLVISDSCYSGALSRDAPIRQALPTGDRERFFENLRTRGPSRILLSSGGNEPVADAGAGLHSIFASALLRGLQSMPESEFTVEELFTRFIYESVAGRSAQVPECTPLRNSGHDSGSFIFDRHR
jgi:tetratricopeptide (TPR) repeat protein